MLMRCVALMSLTATLGACGPIHDGDLLWRFEIKKAHRQWAVVDEQRLYLCADDVYCLDIATGRLLWEFTTFGTHASAPVVADGRLFFQCGGLYALDALTGSVLWEFWRNDWASVAPAVEEDRVYAPVGNRFYCLDAVDGKRVWSVKTGSVVRTPVALGNRVFFSAGKKIFCADGTNGQVLWRFDAGSDQVQLARGGHYLLSVGVEGVVRAHRVETGEVYWQLATGFEFPRVFDAGQGCLLISAGRLYCVNPEADSLLWTFEQDEAFVRESRVLGQRVLARGSRNELYVISRNDGKDITRLCLPDGGRLLIDPIGTIFFSGGQSRKVTCLSVSAL